MKVFSERERGEREKREKRERGAEALTCVFPSHSPHSSWQVGDVVGLNVQLGEVPQVAHVWNEGLQPVVLQVKHLQVAQCSNALGQAAEEVVGEREDLQLGQVLHVFCKCRDREVWV